MDDITITKPTGGMVVIKNSERRFELHHDSKTDDWSVMEVTSNLPQQMWFPTKDDALNYTLGKIEVLENPDYKMAPDRTSA